MPSGKLTVVMAQDTAFSDLLDSASAHDGGLRFEIPADWMQGRTTYGGLSAAFALEVAQRTTPDLPTLRSLSVSFLGPTGGVTRGHARVLRRGRAVTFVECDLECEGRLTTRCTFAFGAHRPSAYQDDFVPMPEVPPPDECDAFIEGSEAPTFTRHFDSRLARGGRPVSSSTAIEHLIWVRHRDPRAAGTRALVAIADMPPPAILPRFSEPASVSSMTWLANIIRVDPGAAPWWLLSTRAESVGDGYSSQDMFVWHESGALAITGRQSVAVFA